MGGEGADLAGGRGRVQCVRAGGEGREQGGGDQVLRELVPRVQGDGAEYLARRRGLAGHRVLRDHVRRQQEAVKSLGIKILPFVEIVAGTAGKVESFSSGPSKISQLQAKLEVHGGCEMIPCTDVSAVL